MEGSWGILRAAGPAAFVAGVALIGYAVVTGGVRLYLFVIFPVITGTAPAFLVGILLLIVGIFLLPMAFLGAEEEGALGERPPPSPGASSAAGSGGLLLVGPVPFFFGTWRKNPPIPYWWAFFLGVVLLVVALLALWTFSVI